MPKYLGENVGATADPVAEVHATTIKVGGQNVVATNDARLPTSDQKAALAGTDGAPSAANKFITASDRSRLAVSMAITGLTGGGATKLDGISTTGISLASPYCLALIDANSGSPVFRVYELVSGTDAESSPTVIRPDDYATTTNERVWKLRDAIGGHAAGHELGGADELDADQLAITYAPTNYTRDDTPAEAGDVDHLTAHLAGIDNALADVLTSRTGCFREITIYAPEMTSDNAAAPTEGLVDFGTINLKAFTFVDAATKAVFAFFVFPQERDTATAPKFKLLLSGTVTGDARIEVSARAGDAGLDLDGAMGTAHAFTHAVVDADDLEQTTAFSLTPAGTSAGAFWVIRIARTGADAADTLAGDVRLIGLRVQFKESTTVPAVW